MKLLFCASLLALALAGASTAALGLAPPRAIARRGSDASPVVASPAGSAGISPKRMPSGWPEKLSRYT